MNIDIKLLNRYGGPTILYNLIVQDRSWREGPALKENIKSPPPDFPTRIQGALATLSPRERWVLFLRYLDSEPRSLFEVAQKFDVTKERIRQIEGKAIRKLHYPSRRRAFIDYGGKQ